MLGGETGAVVHIYPQCAVESTWQDYLSMYVCRVSAKHHGYASSRLTGREFGTGGIQ